VTGKGNQSYIGSIVLPDDTGRNISVRLQTWKEYYDFPFSAEFYADESGEGGHEQNAGTDDESITKETLAKLKEARAKGTLQDGLFGMDMAPITNAEDIADSQDAISIDEDALGDTMPVEDLVAAIERSANAYVGKELTGSLLFSDVLRSKVRASNPSITYGELKQKLKKMWKNLDSKSHRVMYCSSVSDAAYNNSVF
jgi:hypothetical protein